MLLGRCNDGGTEEMTITTEEAERLAIILNRLVMDRNAAALRSLAAERDRLRAENEKLREALQTAQRNALGECISICNAVAHANRVEYPAKWKDRPEGIPHDWQQAWETCAETAENIAAAIRALSDAPSGMVLVPLEPTSAMIQACLQAALDFMAETKTTEVHPGQTYPSASENARRCWRAMVQAAGKGEGDE
jgi:hypothetical protein